MRSLNTAYYRDSFEVYGDIAIWKCLFCGFVYDKNNEIVVHDTVAKFLIPVYQYDLVMNVQYVGCFHLSWHGYDMDNQAENNKILL